MEQEIQDNDILLQQMATFNFAAPIQVTVIFEENDEFNVSLENKNKNSRPCPASKKNVRKPPKQQIQSTNDIYFSKISFDTMERPLHDMRLETQSGPEQSLSNNINTQNSFVAVDRAIHNHKNCEHSQNSRTFLNGTAIQNDKNTNNYRQKESSTDTLSEKEKKEILSLLDKVSCHLIEIFKCYYRLFSYNSSINPSSTEKKMASYLHLKHFFFELSYNTVKSIIIPQEKNEYFIQMYIKRTITLAKKKYAFEISKDYLLSLVNDMIKWTKNAKNFEFFNLNRNEIQPSMPTFNEGLKRKYNDFITNSTNKDNNNICLFSCGPANRQLTISVQPAILNNNLNNENVASAYNQNLRPHATKRRRSKITDTQINKHFLENPKEPTISHLPVINTTNAPQATSSDNNVLYNNTEIHYLDVDSIHDQNQLATSRSSISRDSGFISPLPTTFTGDPMANSDSFQNHYGTPSYTNAMNSYGYTLPSIGKVCCSETPSTCAGCY